MSKPKYDIISRDRSAEVDYIPPEAHSIEVVVCGESDCDGIHLLLLSKDGEGIAQATASREMLEAWIKMLPKRQ